MPHATPTNSLSYTPPPNLSIRHLICILYPHARTLMSGQRCPNDNQINEQIVVVTGGSGGIGFEIAQALAGRGGRIILACRNLKAGERAAAIIKRELGCRTPLRSPDDNPAERYFVEARYLDLCSLRSVHHFAGQLMAEFERIDVLVHNAGVVFANTQVPTEDGFERHSQVNYLAPFLLTHLLLPHLQRSDQGRIIFVSAHAHQGAKIDFDDPLNVGTWSVRFHAREAFAHSKLCVLLATRWLARELKGKCPKLGSERGTGFLPREPKTALRGTLFRAISIARLVPIRPENLINEFISLLLFNFSLTSLI